MLNIDNNILNNDMTIHEAICVLQVLGKTYFKNEQASKAIDLAIFCMRKVQDNDE